MVTVAQGRYTFRIHSDQVGDCGTQSVRTELADYDVDLLLDPGAGTLTGSASATYSCTDCDAAQTVTAAATLDIGSSMVTGEGGVWSYSGTAVVDMALSGATSDNRGSCDEAGSRHADPPSTGRCTTE